jgi:hypothetical protein
VRGAERLERVGLGRVGDLRDRLAGRRVLDRDGVAAGPVAPAPADQQPLGHGIQDAPFGLRLGRGHPRSLVIT